MDETKPFDADDERPREAEAGAGAPACPRCGRPMRMRFARQGPTAGRSFWGCSGYPDCRATRPNSRPQDGGSFRAGEPGT